MNDSPHIVPRRRIRFQLIRALWRYRGRIAQHGGAYQSELATAVKTALDARFIGRFAFATYYALMTVLLVLAVIAWIITVVVALVLGFTAGWWWATIAILPAIGAGVLTYWRLSWGGPLDWLNEHADPARRVSLVELPANLRALAAETRTLADVPANISLELEELATAVEDGPTAG